MNKRFLLAAVCVLALSSPVLCDIYMHNPRGSNNRCSATLPLYLKADTKQQQH